MSLKPGRNWNARLSELRALTASLQKDDNNNNSYATRKSTETYKHNLPSDKERIQELKKSNDRLEEENANLVEENSELKIRLEQQRTRHQNDLKQLEKRLKSEFEDELKSALRIAIDSIEQRGPTVDLLSDPTNVEKQIISYFKT